MATPPDDKDPLGPNPIDKTVRERDQKQEFREKLANNSSNNGGPMTKKGIPGSFIVIPVVLLLIWGGISWYNSGKNPPDQEDSPEMHKLRQDLGAAESALKEANKTTKSLSAKIIELDGQKILAEERLKQELGKKPQGSSSKVKPKAQPSPKQQALKETAELAAKNACRDRGGYYKDPKSGSFKCNPPVVVKVDDESAPPKGVECLEEDLEKWVYSKNAPPGEKWKCNPVAQPEQEAPEPVVNVVAPSPPPQVAESYGCPAKDVVVKMNNGKKEVWCLQDVPIEEEDKPGVWSGIGKFLVVTGTGAVVGHVVTGNSWAGARGGAVASGVCDVVLGSQSWTKSLGWCGGVAGAAGGVAGDQLYERYGKSKPRHQQPPSTPPPTVPDPFTPVDPLPHPPGFIPVDPGVP